MTDNDTTIVIPHWCSDRQSDQALATERDSDALLRYLEFKLPC